MTYGRIRRLGPVNADRNCNADISGVIECPFLQWVNLCRSVYVKYGVRVHPCFNIPLPNRPIVPGTELARIRLGQKTLNGTLTARVTMVPRPKGSHAGGEVMVTSPEQIACATRRIRGGLFNSHL